MTLDIPTCSTCGEHLDWDYTENFSYCPRCEDKLDEAREVQQEMRGKIDGDD